MGNALGRGGRRRRVLNEEIVAASATHNAIRSAGATTKPRENASRYGEAAGVKHHPRISDFVARNCRTIWLGWLLAVLVAAGLVAADFYGDVIARAAGAMTIPALRMTAPGSLASWFSSVVLLLAAAHCLFIFSIRRHRLCDYRGRYRSWLSAAAALLLLSANSVSGLHSVAAGAAANAVGRSFLPAAAEWWMAPALLVFSWIGYRTFRDTVDSRLATWAYAATLLAYAVALVEYLGGLPDLGVGDPAAALVAPTALLLGNIFLLTVVAAYARFVTLEVEGLIPLRATAANKGAAPKKASRQSPAAVNEKAEPASPRSGPARTSSSRPTTKATRLKRDEAAAASARSSAWIDGSQAELDGYDDLDGSPTQQRKMTKSERKRLRKLKAAQRRAA